MKKIISLIIVLAMAVVLASCADVSDVNNTSSDTTASSSTSAPYIEPFEGFFTGVVTNVSEDTVSVDVCEQYKHTLGENITVSLGTLSSVGINKGDEIRVVIDTELEESPSMHKALHIQIVVPEDDRNPFNQKFQDSFNIVPVSEIIIPESFLSALAMKEELPKVSSSWYNAVCRVVKIKDDVVYLTGVYEKAVSAAIIGIPDFSFGVGDYIKITSKALYDGGSYHYRIAYAKDITQMKTLTASEAVRLYVAMDKPVIYLYPEKETECSVKVNFDGKLTCTYPEHGEYGWQNFKAYPDGTLIFDDGKEYYCLYWEGICAMTPDFSEGFCIKGSETAAFLENILSEIGLSAREANEFIIYWLPLLQKNEYNLISFQDKEYTDVAELEIEPAPDSVLRVYMSVKPLDAPIEIAPQKFDGFERQGFTVVEWGGGIISE